MTLDLKINAGNGFYGFKLCGKVVLFVFLVYIVFELYCIPFAMGNLHKLCKLGVITRSERVSSEVDFKHLVQ